MHLTEDQLKRINASLQIAIRNLAGQQNPDQMERDLSNAIEDKRALNKFIAEYNPPQHEPSPEEKGKK